MLPVLRVDDLPLETISSTGERFGVRVERVAADNKINGTFWGEPEAGIVGKCIFVRGDTPVHSFLHELSHIICMCPERRRKLNTDAASDDREEAAVCYLQILIAESVDAIGRARMESDMDAWGYSFPEGDTRSWFEAASDAKSWLFENGLLDADGNLLDKLRTTS